MKQWRKSSRWRKAYERANRRNKVRLWNLVEGEKAFRFGSGWMHVMVEEDCERLDLAMAERLFNNPWIDLLSGKSRFAGNAGSVIRVI